MAIVKALALGAVLATGLAATASAEELRFRAYQGSIALANIIPGAAMFSNTGAISDTASNANFSSIKVSAQGVGVLPNPNYASMEITATSSSTFNGSVTLIILINQQDLNLPTATVLQNTFGAQVLSDASNFSSMTLTHYINANNCIACTTTPMASATFSGPGPSFSQAPVNYLAPADSSWSETIVYAVTFTGPNTTISLSSRITAAVPEPMSMALLGAGLLGLGIARSRRKA